MADFDGEFRRVEDNEIIKKAVNPMAAALRQLAAHNLTHRAVRPTNMFWTTPERDAVVLGDCLPRRPATINRSRSSRSSRRYPIQRGVAMGRFPTIFTPLVRRC